MDSIEQNQLHFFQQLFNRDPNEGELERVMSALDFLSKREKDVLRLRFGLDGSKPRSLLETSKEFVAVTREKVRQIEAMAISKLLHKVSFPEEKAIIPAQTPGKWVIKQDDKEDEFSTFEDAVNEFRKRIRDHMKDYEECYFDGLPFEVGAFFAARDEHGITDEEIVVRHRLSNLMCCLVGATIAYSNSQALHSLNPEKKGISYSGMDVYSNDMLAIEAHEKNGEVKVRIEYGEADENRYLYSNAFSFVNPDIDYYFDSHQYVICGAEDRLGLEANLRLSLSKVK